MSRFLPLDLSWSRKGARGFTLVEMLVAIAIVAILGLILASIADTAGQIFLQQQGQNQYRMQARAVLNYIGRDLRNASLAANQAYCVSNGKPTLEFLINAPNVTYNYPNNIFWQAPIATDGGSWGNMAEVGYFVRWTGGEGDLCRYFVNPSTTNSQGAIISNPDYLIYTIPSGQWIPTSGSGTTPNPGSADAVAPSDNTGNPPHHYKGLFLQNVLGLWVQAYTAAGVLINTSTTPTYNSSGSPYNASTTPVTHSLPAYVVVSIAVLDAPTTQRLKQMSGLASTATTPPTTPAGISTFANYSNAQAYVTAIQGTASLASIRSGISAVTLTVNLNNYK